MSGDSSSLRVSLNCGEAGGCSPLLSAAVLPCSALASVGRRNDCSRGTAAAGRPPSAMPAAFHMLCCHLPRHSCDAESTSWSAVRSPGLSSFELRFVRTCGGPCSRPRLYLCRGLKTSDRMSGILTTGLGAYFMLWSIPQRFAKFPRRHKRRFYAAPLLALSLARALLTLLRHDAPVPVLPEQLPQARSWPLKIGHPCQKI